MTGKSVSFFSFKYVKYVPMYIKCLDFDLDDYKSSFNVKSGTKSTTYLQLWNHKH